MSEDKAKGPRSKRAPAKDVHTLRIPAKSVQTENTLAKGLNISDTVNIVEGIGMSASVVFLSEVRSLRNRPKAATPRAPNPLSPEAKHIDDLCQKWATASAPEAARLMTQIERAMILRRASA